MIGRVTIGPTVGSSPVPYQVASATQLGAVREELAALRVSVRQLWGWFVITWAGLLVILAALAALLLRRP